MRDDTHHNTDSNPELLRPSITAGFVGFLLLAAVCVAALLLISGGVVSLTEFLGTWVGIPPMAMLVAFLGLSLVLTVLVAHARIVAAIREAGPNPFEMLRQQLERAGIDEDDEDDEDEDDDGLEVVQRRRR